MRCSNGFAKDEVAEPRLTRTPHYPRHMPRCIFDKHLNAWQRKKTVPSVGILSEYANSSTRPSDTHLSSGIHSPANSITSVKAIVFQNPYDQALGLSFVFTNTPSVEPVSSLYNACSSGT